MQENTVLICSCTGLNGELLKRPERGVVDLISMSLRSCGKLRVQNIIRNCQTTSNQCVKYLKEVRAYLANQERKTQEKYSLYKKT